MNTYGYTFWVKCPNDSHSIKYKLVITSHQMIMAESITAACSFTEAMYQEEIADELKKLLPGKQRLSAKHGGVIVVTDR